MLTTSFQSEGSLFMKPTEGKANKIPNKIGTKAVLFLWLCLHDLALLSGKRHHVHVQGWHSQQTRFVSAVERSRQPVTVRKHCRAPEAPGGVQRPRSPQHNLALRAATEQSLGGVSHLRRRSALPPPCVLCSLLGHGGLCLPATGCKSDRLF